MKINLNNTEVLAIVKGFLETKGFANLDENTELDFYKDNTGKFVLDIVIGETIVKDKKPIKPRKTKPKNNDNLSLPLEVGTQKAANDANNDVAATTPTTEVPTTSPFTDETTGVTPETKGAGSLWKQ